MQLQALLAFCHETSHHNRGGVNILRSTLLEHKEFRNTRHNPTPEIAPWSVMKDKNEGVANWSKMVRPGAKDHKVFCESNNWVEHKDAFLSSHD